MLCIKHYSYFKKKTLIKSNLNQAKPKLRDEYYIGILTDPVFHFKNIIAKYDLIIM